MRKYKYIKPSAIKALAKQTNGRRVSEQFLLILDAFVGNKVIICSHAHNGGRKTMKGDMAVLMGIKI